MKTIVLIEDGRFQVVLTPENKHEENVLSILKLKKLSLNAYSGSFYPCQGGWTRGSEEKESLMIVAEESHE